MSFDEQLKNAMSEAADQVDPPINSLVAGGVARGRRLRRLHFARAGGGALGLALVGVGTAIAVPQLMTDGGGPAADDGADTVAVEPSSDAVEPSSDDEVVVGLALEMARLSGQPVAFVDLVGDERTSTPGTSTVTVDIVGFGEVSVDVRIDTEVSAAQAGACEPTVGNVCDEVYVSYPTLPDPETGESVDPEGAETLSYVATTASTALYLGINNYVVRDDEVVVGPSVNDLGIDPAAMRQVVAASGVLGDASFPPPGPTRDMLEALALEIGSLTDGAASVISGRGTGSTVRVDHETGSFEIWIDTDDFSRTQWEESCDRGAADGKPCAVVVNGDEAFVGSTSFASHAGRTALRYAADASWGTLTILIDNYVEQATGSKVVGPTWTEAGIDPEVLVDLVEGSGVFSY